MRLNELGVLPKIDRVSSVSGGSITAAILARAWPELEFDAATGIASAYSIREHFTKPTMAATSRTLDVRVGFASFLPFQSAGNRLAKLYDKFIFDGMLLRDIPGRPMFIFNATNLQTGGLFRFTRNYLADWRALKSTTQKVRLSEAGRRIKPNAEYALKPPHAFGRLFEDDPAAVEATVALAARCDFRLDAIRYVYPSEKLPDGRTTTQWLEELTFEGARKRCGGEPPADGSVSGAVRALSGRAPAARRALSRPWRAARTSSTPGFSPRSMRARRMDASRSSLL